MTLLEEQFEVLRRSETNASLQKLPDGTHLVVLPGMKLPDGWSKQFTDIKFLVPIGYPFAKLDCFWTDQDLRLVNGTPPMNTGTNPIPHLATPHLWFSWHVATWNPNVDSLLTYLHVIRRRFCDPR